MSINQSKSIKALGLCSGGLDSMLAGLLLTKQGIDVQWICFETPFFNANSARMASKQTGIPLIVKNITKAYVEMLKNPRQGYGKYMNPCTDCHVLMYQLAGEVMKQIDAHFLFSGEVSGQRPKSQKRSTLRYIEKQSGYHGYILRPLSAKLLPKSIPEENGWVNREQLMAINGRSRKAQIDLAHQFGITDYPNPAGGCLLTDPQYVARLKDLFEKGPYYHDRDLYLLQWGRHFRLNDRYKIIVGKSKQDNENISQYYLKEQDYLLRTDDIPGPTALIPYGCDKQILEITAQITVGYTKAPKNELTTVKCFGSDSVFDIQSYPLGREISQKWIIKTKFD